ncbi:TPA: glycosyltransferase [Candidatus Gracilibacteria bacterium]|nr:glycosyltransferase [Candidatus Gracilibacteria bacterium]
MEKQSELKVAIVAELLTKMGGAERVVEQIYKIFPQADIFTLLYNEKECGEIFPEHKVKTSFLQKYINFGIPKQFLISQFPQAIESFNFDEYDLVISSSSAFAHGIITATNVFHLSYIHAPMRYAWDYTHQYQKEKLTSWKKILTPFLWSTLKNLRIWDYCARDRADVICANSKTTARRIEKFWRKDSIVLYPPVNTKRFNKKLENNSFDTNLKNNFYCIVSMIEPFKNIKLAVQAFQNMPDKKLIIIGDGSQKTELEKLSQNNKNIIFLGRQPDSVVTQHMQNCKAFIFPGLEDFGITPVEANACEKPVIFYNKGGVTETILDTEKEQTGIKFEEQTPEFLQKAVEKLEKNYKNIISNNELFKTQSEKFSEEAFEKNLKNILTQNGIIV